MFCITYAVLFKGSKMSVSFEGSMIVESNALLTLIEITF